MRTNVTISNVQTQTGVRHNCPLNESRYFHIAHNKVFDIMHDILIGVGPMISKLILNDFIIQRGFFTVEFFNGRISSFDYGLMEKK